MKEKIEKLILSLPSEGLVELIDYNIGGRRKTWDAEYNYNKYDNVFEAKFFIDREDVYVIVGENY